MADTAVMSSAPGRSGGSGRCVEISPMGHTSAPGSRPSTQGRPPTSTGTLTPMPDYLRPVVRSAAARWKKLHDDHMMQKLVMKRVDKKERNKAVRDDARSLARKIPMEILARDWLSEQRATADTRAFMVDKLLPTLILGVEKLLIEVDKRGLSETTEPDPNFNPINYLGRYLMRNNPRFSNYCEASPYVRGLREVGEQLKNQLFDIEENKLARIKSEAKKKREERERNEAAVRAEEERREDSLRRQYTDWDVGVYPDGRVELALVQNGLLSFRELSESLPDEEREAHKFSAELEPTDDSGKTLLLKEFIVYLRQFVEEMPAEVFDQFMIHMTRCAQAYRISSEREQRLVTLTQVFVSCDHTGVGLLDRHRVLNLFEMFYDRAQEDIQQTFRNPREWPVVDVVEIDDDNQQDPTFIDNNVDVTMETKAQDPSPCKSEGSDDKPDENKEGGASNTAPEGEAEAPEREGTEAAEEKPEGDETTTTTSAKTEAETGESVEGNTKQSPEGDVPTEVDGATKQAETADEGEVEKLDSAPENEHKEAEEEYKGEEGVGPSEKEKEKSTEDEKEADEAETDGAEVKQATAEDGEPELGALVDDQFPVPPRTAGEAPPMTQQSRVSFAEGTTFQRENTLLSTRGRSQSAASAFDENTLNMSQFIQLTETFMGDEPHAEGFKQLVRWVQDGYMETEEERSNRLVKARREMLSAKRKALLNSLFEMWDNDGSGFLDLDEVETVMKKYKDGVEMDAVATAKKELRKRSKNHDMRLSKREFRDFVYRVIGSMAAGNEHFDYFIDFLLNSVERSYAERVRGEARKKWLQQIVQAGETSAVNMEAVYKAVFQALYKDAETHGNNKLISANIAMLERNTASPGRGDVMLRYVAATPEDAGLVLGKSLFPDMRSVSFSSVETGKPIHVPRVSAHGGVHFWNTDRPLQEREGAFIVVPLKDRRKRVFGLIGIDTLNDPHSRSIFITHEIQFYQGIAKAFSIAYHQVDVRQKTMQISESAVSWIHRRSPHVSEITVYMVEPHNTGSDYVLRKMMVTGHKGNITKYKNPVRLERKDNLFRDYLFKCVDNSESVTADAYGERHMAIPVRNTDGLAATVIDISIGDLKVLPRAENREVTKMLKLLQTAFSEILTASTSDGEHTDEGETGDLGGAEVLFDRLMLIELRQIMGKLDPKAYAELRSYNEPPKVIHHIVKAVLSVFHPEKAQAGHFDNWSNCKQFITPQLSHQIVGYDPTADDTEEVPAQLIQLYLQEVPHGQVNKHGSIPAQYLYNWVFVCVSLIEHTRNMNKNKTSELHDQKNLSGPDRKLKKGLAAGGGGSKEQVLPETGVGQTLKETEHQVSTEKPSGAEAENTEQTAHTGDGKVEVCSATAPSGRADTAPSGGEAAASSGEDGATPSGGENITPTE